MAYNPQNLSAISYANGFTVWHYRTNDPSAEVFAPGYFAYSSAMLRDGDAIYLNVGPRVGLRFFSYNPASEQLELVRDTL